MKNTVENFSFVIQNYKMLLTLTMTFNTNTCFSGALPTEHAQWADTQPTCLHGVRLGEIRQNHKAQRDHGKSVTSSSVYYYKKVLLRERKRHTARRVASARYAGWRGRYPIQSWWGGGYPIQSWWGRGYLGCTPLPHPDLGWITFHHPSNAGGKNWHVCLCRRYGN